MSTYYDMQVEISLDRAALAALSCLGSWQWVERADGEVLDGDVLALRRKGDGYALEASGCFRNLGRYLEEDLACAAAAGRVAGTVVSACVDGTNSLTVTVYRAEDSSVWQGGSECLGSGTVSCWRVEPRAWRFVGLDAMAVLSPVGGDERIDVKVLSIAAESCACGGWDDEAEEPVCGSCTEGWSAPGTLGDELVLGPWLAAMGGAGAESVLDALGGSRGPLADAALEVLLVRGVPLDDDEPAGFEDEGRRAWGPVLERRELELLVERCGGAVSGSGQLSWLLARHPRLHWSDVEAAELLWSAGTRGAVGREGADVARLRLPETALAANRALADEDVLELPAWAVVAMAPWRLGDDELVVAEVAHLVRGGLDGSARRLRDVARVAVGAEGDGPVVRAAHRSAAAQA